MSLAPAPSSLVPKTLSQEPTPYYHHASEILPAGIPPDKVSLLAVVQLQYSPPLSHSPVSGPVTMGSRMQQVFSQLQGLHYLLYKLAINTPLDFRGMECEPTEKDAVFLRLSASQKEAERFAGGEAC